MATNGGTKRRGQKINCYNLMLLKFHLSNDAESFLRHHFEFQRISKKPAKLTALRAFCFLNARDVGSAGSTTMPEAGVSPCKGQYWRQAACPQFEAARASNRNETTASQACRFHASVTAKILQSGQFSGKTPRSCLDEDRTCGIR